MLPQHGETYRAEPANPSLGARLLCAGRFVRGGTVADIGCDHGKLAVWLAKRGNCEKVIAVDSRPMPLARAKALVAQSGTGAVVQCRLGNGLGALAENEARDIVIAGLSAETMMEIIGGCAWVYSPAVHLVLVPASRHARLRAWLCGQGFDIQDERAVQEKGRYYTVLSVCYTGRPTQPSPLFCQLGKVCQGGGDAVAGYIRGRLQYLRGQAKAPMDAQQREQHARLIEEVAACLKEQ